MFETAKRYFAHVYQTRTQPRHPEFPVDWTADLPALSLTLLDRQITI